MKRTAHRNRPAGLPARRSCVSPRQALKPSEREPEPLAKAYCKFGSDRHLLIALISRDVRLVLIQCAVAVGTVLAIRGFF